MSSTWQLSIDVPRDALDAAEELLQSIAHEGNPPAISSQSLGTSGAWRLDAIYIAKPDLESARGQLQSLGFDVSGLEITEVPPVDWVEEALKHHTPVPAGRYYVHGSHHAARPWNRHAILIDAGMAFGTGQHETTLGCLLALDALSKSRRVKRPLDLGCGSGLLAIAMAKTWPCIVTASDIDPEAVTVTRDNAHANRVGRHIKAVTSPGLKHQSLRMRAPYDLITANILARPLIGMAGAIAGALDRSGTLILSGLLKTQECAVLAPYRGRGLRLVGRFPLGEWVTLMLRRD